MDDCHRSGGLSALFSSSRTQRASRWRDAECAAREKLSNPSSMGGFLPREKSRLILPDMLQMEVKMMLITTAKKSKENEVFSGRYQLYLRGGVR